MGEALPMGGRGRLRLIAWWIPVLLAALAACRPRTIADLSSAHALSSLLQKAGASVRETAVLAPPMAGAPSAQTLQVNQDLIHVYEFGSADQAQTIAQDLSLSPEALPWEGRVSIWQAGKLLVIYPGTDGGMLLLLTGLLSDPLSASPEGLEEPYPPAVAAAILAWSESQGLDPATVEVVSYMPAEWLNECLGLPGAGEHCPQGTVAGWVVELRAGEVRGKAHTDELGLHVRLAPAES